MNRYTLTSKLPDYNLEPPEESPEQPWSTQTEEQRVLGLLDEFSPREVAEFYVEHCGHVRKLIDMARVGNLAALERYVTAHRLEDV